MSEAKPRVFATAVGRRKTSIARVRLISGDGSIAVNGQPVETYFPSQIARSRYRLPFDLTQTRKKYTAVVKVSGGGKEGQLTALVLGISRALVKIKEDHKAILKKERLLTRDPRQRQRRMVGTGGKARRKKQSPKR